MSACLICSSAVASGSSQPDDTILCCTVCKQSVHKLCIESNPIFKDVNYENFTCNFCNPTNTKPLNIAHFHALMQCMNSMKLETNENIANIRDNITEIKTNVNNINDTLSLQMTKIEACNIHISTLQEENRILQAKVTEIEQKINECSHKTELDILDRLQRQKNILIKGLEECDDEALNERVNDILSKVTQTTFKAFRIGEITQNRPRMVKVILPDSDTVLEILRGRNKLDANSPKITSDLTKSQRENLSKLYKTLEEKKSRRCDQPNY